MGHQIFVLTGTEQAVEDRATTIATGIEAAGGEIRTAVRIDPDEALEWIEGAVFGKPGPEWTPTIAPGDTCLVLVAKT